MTQIGIIGGGASGLAAAIAAKRADRTAEVFIVEHKDILGKKILSTGNGRCNLTNEVMDIDCFRSEHVEAVRRILEQFGTEQTFSFFRSFGVMMRSRNGYIYPRSAQALSVVEAMTTEANNLGVKVYRNTHVSAIKKTKKSFRISCEDKTLSAEKVILATGGRAASVLGSDGSGYTMAKTLGHALVPVVPALVQLKARPNPLAKASGVRTDATVTAMISGKVISSDTGELQITTYGISGIPVFQISRYIAKAVYEKKQAQVVIDFIPEMQKEEWEAFLICRAEKQMRLNAVQFLESIFPQKLILVLLKLAGINKDCLVSQLSEERILLLAGKCKSLIVDIEDTNGFENAQVCAGGVSLKEVDTRTMESCLIHGLYITGELLDVDGICGGYNLQWAWATGCLAGNAATSKEQRDI